MRGRSDSGSGENQKWSPEMRMEFNGEFGGGELETELELGAQKALGDLTIRRKNIHFN